MRYLIKETIEAAHQLKWHKTFDGKPGKCSRMHGHSYRIEVEIVLPYDLEPWREKGVPIDFGLVKREILKHDHTLLNKVVSNPSAENFAWMLHNDIKGVLVKELEKKDLTLAYQAPFNYQLMVRVWETDNCMVEVSE